MTPELTLSAVGLIVSVLLGLFVLIPKIREAGAAREDIIARRRGEELTRLYARLDEMEIDLGTQAKEIKELQAHVALSDRRENLMYHHMKALREHIISELPPPPPSMPAELTAWFEELARTDPGH